MTIPLMTIPLTAILLYHPTDRHQWPHYPRHSSTFSSRPWTREARDKCAPAASTSPNEPRMDRLEKQALRSLEESRGTLGSLEEAYEEPYGAMRSLEEAYEEP